MPVLDMMAVMLICIAKLKKGKNYPPITGQQKLSRVGEV